MYTPWYVCTYIQYIQCCWRLDRAVECSWRLDRAVVFAEMQCAVSSLLCASLCSLPDKPALRNFIQRTTELRKRASTRVNNPQVEYIRWGGGGEVVAVRVKYVLMCKALSMGSSEDEGTQCCSVCSACFKTRANFLCAHLCGGLCVGAPCVCSG